MFTFCHILLLVDVITLLFVNLSKMSLGVKMIDTLMKTTQNNRNAFTQGIVGYALSNSKDSSAFIKIYD